MKYTIIFGVLFSVAAASTFQVDWNAVKTFNEDSTQNDITARITQGTEAAPKQFPYQVGLLLYAQNGTYWCGGSLISNRWILTAAHCTDSLSKGVDVYLGAHNRKNRKERNQVIIFVATKYVIVHEEWNTQTTFNDISLIKLPVEIEFNDYIQPVNLPQRTPTYSTYEDQNAIASGWGRLGLNETGDPNVLRWIEATVMKNKVCSRYHFGSVKPTMICIRTKGGASTCYGDSGGPLVLADGSRTLIGITSFGTALGCGAGFPAVFTRTTSYLDWIAEKTGLVI